MVTEDQWIVGAAALCIVLCLWDIWVPRDGSRWRLALAIIVLALVPILRRL